MSAAQLFRPDGPIQADRQSGPAEQADKTTPVTNDMNSADKLLCGLLNRPFTSLDMSLLFYLSSAPDFILSPACCNRVSDTVVKCSGFQMFQVRLSLKVYQKMRISHEFPTSRPESFPRRNISISTSTIWIALSGNRQRGLNFQSTPLIYFKKELDGGLKFNSYFSPNIL